MPLRVIDAMRPAIAAAVFWWGAQTGAGAATLFLPPGQTCTEVPFALIDNRTFIDVTVEGKGPFRFIFDTGANNILDLDLAKSLGLALTGQGQSGGAGAAQQDTWRTPVKALNASGLAIQDASMMVLSLAPIRNAIGFERLDGLLGREVLNTYVTRFDYDRGQLTFCAPDAAADGLRTGMPLEISFGRYNSPITNVQIDGRAVSLLLDTGDRSTLTLFTPFVKENDLRRAYPVRFFAVTGFGVGGPIPADVTRAAKVTFGGVALSDVPMRMPTLTSGGFTASDISGTMGTGVLRRFNVTYDFGRQRIHISPNSQFKAAQRYDRSGLWLAGHDKGFEIRSVLTGGEAERAGVVTGDIVTGVDGTPAKAFSLIALRDRLMDDPPGTQVRFELLDRQGATRIVTVTLKDLI